MKMNLLIGNDAVITNSKEVITRCPETEAEQLFLQKFKELIIAEMKSKIAKNIVEIEL
ncbi:MAG: hypothetical protein M0P35_00635 [Bacteroidales bacterium]|jgi:hypothetical protein|nr:hypothetical protein [Bacteroidales bacterium]